MSKENNMSSLLVINKLDNVGINLDDGHKYALRDISCGENIIKYGQPIGHATCDIAVGEHVHTHNVKTNLSGKLEYSYEPSEVHGEKVESEFIADPASSTKRAAWNRVQAELQALNRPSYKLIADHIDHVVELVGIDHVGIGSDYDGIEVTPAGMEDISKMPLLFEELKSRGYTENDLSKIASDNFFRLLK